MQSVRQFFSHRLVWLALVVSLGIGALFARAIWTIRSDEWNYATQTNANLASALEHNLSWTLRTLDDTLRGVVTELERADLDRLAPALRKRLLFDTTLRVPGVGSVLVIDAQGLVRYDSEGRGTDTASGAPRSFADRDYFKAFAAGQHDGVFIGTPVPSRLTGLYILPVAHAWKTPDGAFAGVVVGAIQLGYLKELFGTLDLGPNSGVNLFHADGTVIVRFPYGDADVGTSLSGSENMRQFQSAPEGVTMGRASIDGVERLYAWRHVSGYPLILNVAQSTDALRAQWYRNALVLGGFALFLMVASVGLAGLFVRELVRRQQADAQLRDAERDLRTILHSLPSLVSYWDMGLRNRYANSAYLDWFGHTPEQLRGMHIRDLLGPEQFAISEPFLRHALMGERQIFERTYPDRKGRLRHVIVSYVPDREANEVRGVFVQVTDITDRKRMEDELFEEKELVRLTLQSIGDAVVCVDERGHITYLNPVAERLTGWQGFDAADRPVDEVLQVRQPDGSVLAAGPLRRALEEGVSVEPTRGIVLGREDSVRYVVEESASPILDRHGHIKGAVAVLRDVTDAVAMAERMEHLAQYDALTDLPNRVLLQDRARQAMAQARRDGKTLAVVYLDLDGFKAVNDTRGHEVGDQLLVQFARRLAAAVRQSDTVCRQGGDEFVLLLPGLESAELLGAVAAKLLAVCDELFELPGGTVRVGLSAGVSLFPQHGQTLDELSRHADAAMYAAKQAGRQQVRVYVGEGQSPALLAQAQNRDEPDPGAMI